MIRRPTLRHSLLAAACSLPPAAWAEQVQFSEINYNPSGGRPEFIEVYNATVTPIDIARWRLAGAVDYVFPDFDPGDPQRTYLNAFERVLLAPVGEAAFRASYPVPAGVTIYGPWEGNLDNGGEEIVLEDKNGVVACRLTYGDRGRWPVSADGAGHTLVLQHTDRPIDDYRNWAASRRPGGTPGSVAVGEAEEPVTSPEINLEDGLPIVQYGDTWRYHDGNQDLGTAWRAPDFNDAGWSEGPGLFGFENSALPAPGIQTGFNDEDQLTYYLRKAFDYTGETEEVTLSVDLIVDDGVILYLNGQELGRVGADGVSDFDDTASRTVGNATEEADVITVGAATLLPGRNVLAAEVHQTGTTSSDVVFGARLKVTVPSRPSVVINEIFPGGAGSGFIEFYNPGDAVVDLDGFYLTDDSGDLRKFRVQGQTPVAPGALLALGFVESGFDPATSTSIFVVDPDGSTVVNAVGGSFPLDGRSLGRKPSGGGSWFLFTDPTRGFSNRSQGSLGDTLTLSEVHFSGGAVDWVELHNADGSPVATEGLFLASRRDFSDQVALGGEVPGRGEASWDVNFPLGAGGEVALFLVDSGGAVLAAEVFTRPPNHDYLAAFPPGSRDFYASPVPSRDATNAPPRETAIVINEILFDPPSNSRYGEFIELYNRGAEAVDLSGWRFVEGVTFTFPGGTTLAPGGYLAVVSNAAFMAEAYGAIPMVGDYQGQLSNRGEMIRLVDRHGNLADEVFYECGGDWPALTRGLGSSMELVHPDMDNAQASAWRDSDESAKTSPASFSLDGRFSQTRAEGGPSDYKELHFHLVGDGHAVLQNIQLRRNGTGANLIQNATAESSNGQGNTGWLLQGTHAKSYLSGGALHLISTGHGDNRPNRAEIDVTAMNSGDNLTLTFDARWVYGKPRLIAQTWDHSFGGTFLLEVPDNLGTPGAPNSRRASNPAPTVDGVLHSPAVPTDNDDVRITARVTSAAPLTRVEIVHRRDSNDNGGNWATSEMFDDGFNGGDEVAGDGVFTGTLNQYKSNTWIVQFYVRATSAGGGSNVSPPGGEELPALYVVDDPNPSDLLSIRAVVSAYDTRAISSAGGGGDYGYAFPRLSNAYKNCTLIVNETDVYYNGEIRNSGSPWTRSENLTRGKMKFPYSKAFRGHVKFQFDNDAAGGRRYHNRIIRYWLYLMGHPANENEFFHYILNSGNPDLRELVEPVANDFIDRIYPEGTDGELYRIDDEWWFRDDWGRSSRNADWRYKGTHEPVRYHTEWMKRSRETDYDYSSLTEFIETVSANQFSQEEIERMADPEAIAVMTAVRGYVDDWDSFTRNRGKNGYFYRRPTDGRFMFLHWDSDLTFGNSSVELFSGVPGVNPYLTKSYNERRIYHYIAQMVDHYTRNSERMEAWFSAEEDASGSFSIDENFYRTWFNNREGRCLSEMGTNHQRALSVSSPASTLADTLTVTGTAGYRAHEVRVTGHPEAIFRWTGETSWEISGIRLGQGENDLEFIAYDSEGDPAPATPLNPQARNVTVTKADNAAPSLVLGADPASWNLGLTELLELDAGGSYDPEGGSLEFEWAVTGGAGDESSLTVEGEGERATAAFTRPGHYRVSLTATDGDGRSSSLAGDASVFGFSGFSSFGGARLEDFWTAEQVTPRTNGFDSAWFSLEEDAGELTLGVLDDFAKRLQQSGGNHPWIHRPLPADGDFSLAAQVHLNTVQFGDFMAGLLVEVQEGLTTRRYALGIEDGDSIAAKRVSASGSAQLLRSTGYGGGDATLRIRREGTQLHFEQREDLTWSTFHSVALSGLSTAVRGGVFLATDAAQRVEVGFDYAGLVDPGAPSDLRGVLTVSEVMYDPVGGSDLEFIELLNTGDAPVSLQGVRTIEGAPFDELVFGGVTVPAGGRVLLVANREAFLAAYGAGLGAQVVGEWAGGRLSNGGETVTLADAAGNLVFSFVYDNNGGWPGRAAGLGSSIEPVDPLGDLNDPANWRASAEFGGTPGTAGTGPSGDIVINEVLTHTDPPALDAVELHNASGAEVDIGGWYLSDAEDDLAKFRVPDGTVIAAGGYLVFDERDFNPNGAWNPAAGPPAPWEFALGSAGDGVHLTAADAGGSLLRFEARQDFGPAANGVSFGRFENGVGEAYFTAQSATTLGGANAGPLIGEVVITEVMYNPPAGGIEFVELQNISGAPVALFDPDFPGNAWELGGAAFAFPAGVTLAPGEIVLVASVSAAEFRAAYDLPPDIRVFGPFAGNLQDGGESLALRRPDTPDAGDEADPPMIDVDVLVYRDEAPWPAAPDGTGPSLERVFVDRFASDPGNWRSSDLAGGNPGETTLAPTTPQIRLDRFSLAATVTLGENLADVPLSISNSGIEVLDYTVTSDRTWLTVSPGTGNSDGPGQIVEHTLSFETAGLAKGMHTATVTVADPAAANSPRQVAVSVEVVQGEISVDASTIEVRVSEGGVPAPVEFELWNATAGTDLDYTLTTDAPWLSVSPPSGTSGGEAERGTHTLTFDTDQLPARTYFANVVVDAPGAANTPLRIAVTLTVEVPGLFAAYNDFGWSGGQRTGNFSRISASGGPEGTSGSLVDFETGDDTDVTLTVTGGDHNGTTGGPAQAGTEGAEIFNGVLDAAGAIMYTDNLDCVLSFTGLDPVLTYELTLFGNRNNPAYDENGQNRRAIGTISGAASFTNTSTAGALVSTRSAPDDTTTVVVGYNTERGYVHRFSEIRTGADGAFAVTFDSDGSQSTRYYVNAMLLTASGPPPVGETADTWLAENFAPGEARGELLDDFSGDGIANLLAYAFGLDPRVRVNTADLTPVARVSDGGDEYVALQFRRRLTARDLQFVVEVSDNLAAWTSGGGATQVVSAVDNGDGTETLTVRDTTPVLTRPARFIRLRVVATADP